MVTQRRTITKNDVEAVGYPTLIVAAILSFPIGAVLGYIFAMVWLAILPAGDSILLLCPIMGAFGGLLLGPAILIGLKMASSEPPGDERAGDVK